MGDDATIGLTAARLPDIVSGEWLSYLRDRSVEGLFTDTRHLPQSNNGVFFAINGANHDGHDYIDLAYKLGVKTFIVEERIELEDWPEANVLLVSSSIAALQQLVEYKRDLFDIEVIGITGSNGKTIVKEWLSAILQSETRLVKSPKSYNSQIGVPLSVWQMDATHELGIFEAGISKPGEMSLLAQVIKPSVGLMTNIGSAHDAGFDSWKEKLDEKLELFMFSDTIIYCADQELVDTEIQSQCNGKELLSWSSTGMPANIQFNYHADQIDIAGSLGKHSLKAPFSDSSSLQNLSHVIVTLRYLGLDFDFIQQGISHLNQVKMRLELKEGLHQTYLVDDSYNNDISGLKVALDFLSQQKQYKKKTLILAPIEQAAESDREVYGQVGKLLEEFRIDRVIGIGASMSQFLGGASMEKRFYESVEDYFDAKPDFHQEVILIKGARNYQLERIVSDLQQKHHETSLEINLEALVHNLNVYRRYLKPETRLMVMVKAMAYGSGIREVAQVLEHQKVDYVGVAYTDEGVELRKNGITLPIMVMNPSTESFDLLAEYKLEPEIYDINHLESYIGHFSQAKAKPPIHLKLETGMHRLGFLISQLDTLLDLITTNSIPVAGILTHLAGADSADHDEYSRNQIVEFLKAFDKIAVGINSQPLRHVLNSPGLLRFPEYHFDMVRLGIGLYGFDASHKIQGLLRVVGTLKSHVSRVEMIEQDESIGYGRSWIASRKTKVATIPIGYADGYRRTFSNGMGHVNVNGVLVPVIGNVCMDMCMIDVTDVFCEVGDEVILFGDKPSIQDLAEWSGTIPYEILTNVSGRVRRTYLSE